MHRRTTPRRGAQARRSLRALLVLGIGVSACATDDGQPAAVVEVGTIPTATVSGGIVPADAAVDVAVDVAPDVASDQGDAGATDGPEYGDSVHQYFDIDDEVPATTIVTQPGFRAVDWEELVEAGFDVESIIARFEERFAELEPGSPEADALYDEMKAEYDAESVNTQLDGEAVQLAGFVAPLTFDGDSITEFLLVPYYGACIHVPPPPANQTVIVSLADGESLTLEQSWGAVWVAGEMLATTTVTDLASAGYALTEATFGVYENQ